MGEVGESYRSFRRQAFHQPGIPLASHGEATPRRTVENITRSVRSGPAGLLDQVGDRMEEVGDSIPGDRRDDERTVDLLRRLIRLGQIPLPYHHQSWSGSQLARVPLQLVDEDRELS